VDDCTTQGRQSSEKAEIHSGLSSDEQITARPLSVVLAGDRHHVLPFTSRLGNACHDSERLCGAMACRWWSHGGGKMRTRLNVLRTLVFPRGVIAYPNEATVFRWLGRRTAQSSAHSKYSGLLERMRCAVERTIT
jgi:hypothetical protein